MFKRLIALMIFVSSVSCVSVKITEKVDQENKAKQENKPKIEQKEKSKQENKNIYER